MKIIRPANLRKWAKVGNRIHLASVNGLALWSQVFFNPETGEHADFSFFSKKEGITVCSVTKDGGLILVREFKQGADDIVLGFPAGLLDERDVTKKESALRELMEETGYRPEKVIVYNHVHIAPRKSPCREWLAVALDCEPIGKPSLDRDEGKIEVIEMPQEEFFQAAREGRFLISESTMAAAFVAIMNGHIRLSGVDDLSQAA